MEQGMLISRPALPAIRARSSVGLPLESSWNIKALIQVTGHLSNESDTKEHRQEGCLSLDISGCVLQSTEGLDEYGMLSCLRLSSVGLTTIAPVVEVRICYHPGAS